jgi:hypothetical protein
MGTFSKLGRSSARGKDGDTGELGCKFSGSGEFSSNGAVTGEDAAVPA